MDILILYPEIMPYNLPVWRIIRDKGYCIRVIQLGNKKLTPFQYNGEAGIEVHDISEWNNYQSFKEDNYSEHIKLLFVSEVMNKWYWRLARKYHAHFKDLPIVLGSDAQWTGSRNNYIKKILYPLTYKNIFTHVLSAGLWQVVYALNVGFKREQILTPLYCANNELYYSVDINRKIGDYPRRFLFVGRFNEVKGIREMLQAWSQITQKKGWVLTLVGNGPMEEEIKHTKDIEILPFLQQDEICRLMQSSGCALVPSRAEPWGLVIHEATAAGMPIIVSRNCGATHRFVINNYNGLIVEARDVDSLQTAMQKVIDTDTARLIEMSKRSRKLSETILPEHVAYSLISLVKELHSPTDSCGQ